MCAKYETPDSRALERIYEIKRSHGFEDFLKGTAYPGSKGPVARLEENDPVWVNAQFGLLPYWCKPEDAKKLMRKTYNARTETVEKLASYKTSWKYRRFCIVPAQAIYEPNYETGKPVWWRIERIDGNPILIAGIHAIWKNATTDESFNTFSMLTINATNHPLMNRFHSPTDEKRMVVMLHDEHKEGWLRAANHDEARAYFNQYPVDAG